MEKSNPATAATSSAVPSSANTAAGPGPAAVVAAAATVPAEAIKVPAASSGARVEGGCSDCKRVLGRESYSNKQWKKLGSKRCLACVAKLHEAVENRTREKRKAIEMQKQRKLQAEDSEASSQVRRLRKLQSMVPGTVPSDEQVATAVSVCLFASVHKEQYLHGPKFKLLRCAVASLLEEGQRRLFGGQTKDDYQSTKRMRAEKLKEKQRKAALDRKLINQRKLRSARIQNLQQLMEQGGGGAALPLIADGAVDDGRQVRVLTDGRTAETRPATTNVEVEDISESDANPQSGDADSEASAQPEGEAAEASSGESARLHTQRSCYICKARYSDLHHFYSDLCPACAELNFCKRNQVASLTGKIALLTGGRVKIGFHTGLKLLRCGASLIVTTRFPKDCALRYAKEPDFPEWKSRLKIYGLDLRDIKTLERFCATLVRDLPRLDIIVNNACQTIRRPRSYYQHLLPTEARPLEDFNPDVQGVVGVPPSIGCSLLANTSSPVPAASGESEAPSSASSSSDAAARAASATTAGVSAPVNVTGITPATTSQAPTLTSAESSQQVVISEDAGPLDPELFPKDVFDVNKQQLDLRRRNSWLLRLGEIETGEVAEVFAINSIAPFVINSKLKPLMMRSSASSSGGAVSGSSLEPRFIINVSAMEGKFYRFKSSNHPHTNMAKAALNMMTRTSAADYAESQIYMNAVDTGWINDENPLEKARGIAARHNFQTPIDEVDAAARILDPVMVGVNEHTFDYGKFFKDYKETQW